ncbi:MAG: hypothetical protein KDJ33_08470 [Gammaproteobacteria bacterium]|nr:hypothetical protein [Gammaproteobacteria bacterium]
MSFSGVPAMLHDFHETIRAMRTGESGRANVHFAQLIQHLSRCVEQQVRDAHTNVATVINAMLAAKQRQDSIGLADLLQYALPQVLDESELSPALLDLALIRRLRALDPMIADPERIERLVEEIHALYQDHPDARGVGAYFAGQLSVAKRASDARLILAIDHELGRHSPASAYLYGLALAYCGDLDAAISTMQWAYANSTALQDGFSQLAAIAAGTQSWDKALELARHDEAGERMTPPWQAKLAQLYARAGDFDHAVATMHKAYAATPDLRDGFATLAWILEAAGGDNSQIVTLLEEDRARERLSAAARLRGAKHYLWAGDRQAALQRVEEAYDADAEAQAGYGRLAAAALIIGDDAFAIDCWSKDRKHGREDATSASRFDFMQRPTWSAEAASVYIYQIHGKPDLDAVQPVLARAYAAIGERATIEVEPGSEQHVRAICPAWQTTPSTIFGGRTPPVGLPASCARLALRDMLELFAK